MIFLKIIKYMNKTRQLILVLSFKAQVLKEIEEFFEMFIIKGYIESEG